MSEVIDVIPDEVVTNGDNGAGAAIVAAPPAAVSLSEATARLRRLQDVGFIAPIASPEELRAAFAYQQQVYAAILSPDDYLYTVTFPGSSKPFVTRNQAEAARMADEHQGSMHASPLKGGVTKLARALGITARRALTKGLPEEPSAQYAYVEYVAEHKGTSRTEIGVGWCDYREGRASAHVVIATADTRAYTRAVLRLAGFSEVSGDEVLGETTTNLAPGVREVIPPPSLDDPGVIAAARAWAEAVVAQGKRYAPTAQQVTQHARELRASARRGDYGSAQQLGAQGLHWQGAAQDGLGMEPWEVGPSPVTPEMIQATAPEAAASAPPSGVQAARETREQAALDRALGKGTGTKTTNAAPPTGGWDLSGKGSKKDDAGPKTASESPHGIPGPDLAQEAITMGQAKKLSLLAFELFDNDKDQARTWLREHCHIQGSVDMRPNQYEIAMSVLNKLVTAKKEAK